jgi:uncharacterized protein (TIGR02271 family)
MANETDSTIIAVFRNNSDAQAAAADLERAGISRDDIYIESASNASTTSQTTGTSHHHEGGIVGWFKSVFGEENETDRSGYEYAVQQGNCLLRVDVDEDNIPTVEDVLNRHSPVDVQEEDAAATSAGTTSAQATQSSRSTQTRQGTPSTSGTAIPVVREEIQIGKRQVSRGGVRVYTRVVEEPVEETIKLREERARVERTPVNRAANPSDLSAREEQVIEVQEFAEEPVVAKQARVVEEVRVGKDVSERSETVRDKVRRTEVKVEQTPGTGAGSGSTSAASAGYDDSDFRSDYQQRYGNSGATYDTYMPAYRYGYDMASDPRYQGRSFNEVESDLRNDYGRRYPNSTWEKMKDAVRYGWDKVTGKTHAASR